MFLTESEARTVEAIAERVFPADDHGPGARGVDAIIYIDRSLAGYGRHLHGLYRTGITALDAFVGERFGGSTFSQLADDAQDKVLRQVEALAPSVDENEQAALLVEFFGAVRLHTLEGIFCDPMYGGNRDAAGWKLIGFPGAQWGYSAEEMKPGYDATIIPIKTLADLRRGYLAAKDKGGKV